MRCYEVITRIVFVIREDQNSNQNNVLLFLRHNKHKVLAVC